MIINIKKAARFTIFCTVITCFATKGWTFTVPLPTVDISRVTNQIKSYALDAKSLYEDYEHNKHIIEQIQHGGFAAAGATLFNDISTGRYNHYGESVERHKQEIQLNRQRRINKQIEKAKKKGDSKKLAKLEADRDKKAKDRMKKALTEAQKQAKEEKRKKIWSKISKGSKVVSNGFNVTGDIQNKNWLAAGAGTFAIGGEFLTADSAEELKRKQDLMSAIQRTGEGGYNIATSDGSVADRLKYGVSTAVSSAGGFIGTLPGQEIADPTLTQDEIDNLKGQGYTDDEINQIQEKRNREAEQARAKLEAGRQQQRDLLQNTETLTRITTDATTSIKGDNSFGNIVRTSVDAGESLGNGYVYHKTTTQASPSTSDSDTTQPSPIKPENTSSPAPAQQGNNTK